MCNLCPYRSWEYNMKYFFVVFLSLMTSFVWAADGNGIFDRGNGGDVVICIQPDGERTYQVLDLYEQPERGYTPRHFSSKLSYIEIVQQEIAHIKRHLPRVAKALTVELRKLQANLYFVKDDQIPDIQDEYLYSSLTCELKQLAVQWREGSYHGRVYWINSRYFPHLDEKNKAALILHELLYRLFSADFPDEVPNSRTVRKYVGLFLSEEFDKLAPTMFPRGFLIYLKYY